MTVPVAQDRSSVCHASQRGGRSPFWDLGHDPQCSPRVGEPHLPPALHPHGGVAFPQVEAQGSCSTHTRRLGLHLGVSLGLGDRQ